MKKIAICPKCNTKIFCEGEPGQKKIVQCGNCGGKGYISFAKEDTKRTLEDLESKISKKLYHKIVIGGKESEENILKKLEAKRLKKEGKGELRETFKPFIGEKDKQKEQELIKQEHEKKEEERTRKIEARNALIEKKKKERADKLAKKEEKKKLLRQQKEDKRLKKIEKKQALKARKEKELEAKIAQKEKQAEIIRNEREQKAKKKEEQQRKKIEEKNLLIEAREKEKKAQKAKKEKAAEQKKREKEKEYAKKIEEKEKLIEGRKKDEITKKIEKENAEKLKRKIGEKIRKEKEEERARKIEARNALIEKKKKERADKLAKKEEKKKLLRQQKEDKRLKKIEEKNLLIEAREKEKKAQKAKKEKAAEEKFTLQEQKRKEEEEQRLKKIEAKKVLKELKAKERKTILDEKKKKRELPKYESKILDIEEKQKERARQKAEKEKAVELKRKLQELKKKEKIDQKAKKIEAKKALTAEKEEKIEAQEAKEKLDLDLKKELQEKKRREKQEEKIKKIEAKKALKEAKEEERLAKRVAIIESKKKKRKLSKYELKILELEEKQKEQPSKKIKKKDKAHIEKTPITVEENIEQIDFYPVNEPFAYIKILKDTETLEKFYKVIQPDLSEEEQEIFRFIQDKFIKTMDMRLDELDPTLSENYLFEFMDQILRDHEIVVDDMLKRKLTYCVKKEFLGFGKIDPLMKDPNIEDISCDGSEIPIFLHHRKYGSVKSNINFNNENELAAFVVNLAQKCGKHISLAEPMLDATMPDGSRIQMTLSNEITAKGSTFTIRKFRADPITPTDLIGYNTMSADMIAYMWLAVENGINALIAGSTAAGKTSTLNALSLFIPRESKIVSIEETREINLPHANWIPGVARSGFGEIINDKLVGEIDLFDLMKAALRQRPEYILVGEIRGREAYVLFQAMATGHTTYSTFHADSPKSVIHRLEGKPIDIPRVMLQTLDIVFIQVSAKVGDKRVRRCKQIVEIIDIDPNTKEILSNEVFRWDPVEDSFTYSGKSYVLERIRSQHDLSKEEMTQEVRNRVVVLEWMRKKDIRVFNDVARIISLYTENQEELMDKITKDSKIEELEKV